MKYLILLLIAATVNAKTIKEGDTEYQCSPKKTCDEQLKAAKAEIKRLKKQLAENHSTKTIVQEIEVETVVTKTEIKKHIISVLGVSGVTDLTAQKNNANSATAMAETGYLPAVTYQYQMDIGLVPLIGAKLDGRLPIIIGLGFEF